MMRTVFNEQFVHVVSSVQHSLLVQGRIGYVKRWQQEWCQRWEVEARQGPKVHRMTDNSAEFGHYS